MSTFKRTIGINEPSISTSSISSVSNTLYQRGQRKGCKPFLNGQTLISSGQNQFDTIIGGGLLLGTILLFETPQDDTSTFSSIQYINDMQRYFTSEGIVSGHSVLIVCEDPDDYLQYQVPLELSLAQKQVLQQHQANIKNSDITESKESHDGLKIAWQYKKYQGNALHSSKTTRFCHSYDLSQSMPQDVLETNSPTVINLQDIKGSTCMEKYKLLFNTIETHWKVMKQLDPTKSIVRVMIKDIGSSYFGAINQQHMKALLLFLYQLKALVSDESMICQLSGHFTSFPTFFHYEIRHLCHYNFMFKSFLGDRDLLPDELSTYDGIMEIQKLARIHSLTCHTVDDIKYGIKRDRRKLKIEKLHLPPEGSRTSNIIQKEQTKSIGKHKIQDRKSIDPLDF